MATVEKTSIDESEVIPMLVAACPSFAPKYNSLVHDWRAEFEEDVQNDTVASAYAKHLIDRLEASDTSTFADVFGVIEKVLTHGDEPAREIVVVSIIFDLREHEGYTSKKPVDLFAFAGPTARRAWKSGDEFLAPPPSLKVSEWAFVAVFTGLVLALAYWLGCG